jgi:hypothetical protein
LRQELEDKLLERYPWMIARNVWTDEVLDFCTPCSCGDGWYQLIYDLCGEIEKHYKKNSADINVVRILQIKEKYAQLCFYTGGLIECTHEIIHKFEEKSTQICECCGQSGIIKHKGSWLRTLCIQCAKEQGYIDFEENT